MQFRPIKSTHPYLKALAKENDEPDVSPKLKREFLFQPAEGRTNWPIYSVAIWTPEFDKESRFGTGFTFAVCKKDSMKSWWTNRSDLFDPIPYELLPHIMKILADLPAQVERDRAT